MKKGYIYRKSNCSTVKHAKIWKKGSGLVTRISLCVGFPFEGFSLFSLISSLCFNILFPVYLVNCFYISGVWDPLWIPLTDSLEKE